MNRRLEKLSLATFAILFAMASCIKMPENNVDPKPEPPQPPVNTTAKNLAELKVSYFAVEPSINDGVHMPIIFIDKSDPTSTFNGVKEIRYYKADLSSVKATFTSNASKVEVSSVQQTSGVTSNNMSSPIKYRFYALDGNYREMEIKLTNPENSYSGLQLLVVNMNNNAPIISKDEWLPGNIKLDKQLSQYQNVKYDLNVKGRGNSTWSMPKKPFALQLKDKNSLLGMTKHKRWALLANYGDKTLLRNKVSFEIAKRTKLSWTPDSRFVELILNGEYIGNYLLVEQIRRDPNRVNVAETDDKAQGDAITGGYIIELDRYNKSEPGCIILNRSKLPALVKDPEIMNSQQKQYITDYLNNIETLLYKDVPDSLEYGQYIDINSFIDYWIVYELTGNRDIRLPGSCYMYKDINKKLCAGPVWDFDLTTFMGGDSFILANYDPQPGSPDYETYGHGGLWFGKLFKDPKFKAKAKARWAELYTSGVFNTIPQFIDQEANLIKKSADFNWKPSGIWNSNMGTGTTGRNHDEELPWVDAVAKMKDNFNKRLARVNYLVQNL